MVSVRRVLVVLGVAFTLYQAARGLIWTRWPAEPWMVALAIIIYLVVAGLCLFISRPPVPLLEDAESAAPRFGRRERSHLPMWVALAALAATLIVPTAVGAGVGPVTGIPTYATWYIGGLGALMVIVMVRRRPWIAWGGTILIVAGALFWMGADALRLGAIGSIVWVGIAHLLQSSIDRAARDTGTLAELESAASAWQASQEGRDNERRVQVQRALAIAGPVLTRVIVQEGALSDEDRAVATLAEMQLRDELRGMRLLDDRVRAAVAAARLRGVQVALFDDGGLEGVDAAALTNIRAELAETIATAPSRHLIVRTSPDEQIAVTVVGRASAGRTEADESVDLWREIAHQRDSAPVGGEGRR